MNCEANHRISCRLLDTRRRLNWNCRSAVSKILQKYWLAIHYLLCLLVAACIVIPVASFAAEDLTMPPSMIDDESQPAMNSMPGYLSGLTLASIRMYFPKVIDRSDGVRLARLFGDQGVAVKVSYTMPESTYQSLRARGGRYHAGAVNSNELTQAYMFVQKRW